MYRPLTAAPQARDMDDYSSIIMRLVTSEHKLRAVKAQLHAARLTSAFDIELRDCERTVSPSCRGLLVELISLDRMQCNWTDLL